ncbi:MAG TPA: YoaK family protein [Solirubrobacterales bacterium]|nr:YoaK family protein [Solirubrobacterales bacterium]
MSLSRTQVLLALTFVTGIVDAVSFLGLGQVFAGMQTGNVIFLGFGIAGAAGAAVAMPLISLGSFVVGGGLATLLARPGRSHRRGGLGPATAIEAALLAGAALYAAAAEITPGDASAYLPVALLSLAMGLRNTVVRGLGDANLATTVLNLTATAFTSQSPLGIASGGDLAERAGALVAILAGAVAGALLLKTSLTLALLVAAAVTLAAGLAHLRVRAVAA